MACPECDREVRPCNLARHRQTHFPRPVPVSWGTRFMPARRPIRGVDRRHDRRYDEVFPRGIGPFRYRIYRLRAGELELLAAAPSAGGMGLGLVCLYAEGEYITDDVTGVLDTRNDPGDWIVHPFSLGRRPVPEAVAV